MAKFPKFQFNRLGDYASFTDESSISGHKYMVIGGVTCSTSFVEHAHDAVEYFRYKSKYPTDSFQWKHYRDDKWLDYKRLIDWFIENNTTQNLDFSCIVIDTKALDHSKHNEGDGETFFQKMVGEHVYAIVRKYEPEVVRLFHGHRESKYDLEHVKSIINSTIAKKQGFPTYRPLRQFDYLRVEDSGPHQIADILLGCVSYYWNSGMVKSGSSRKRKLAEYVHSECCVPTLAKATPYSSRQFSVWPFKLRSGPRA